MAAPIRPDRIELIWVDLETTGLDDHKDEILEIAMVGTDKYGNDVQLLLNELVLPPSWTLVRGRMDQIVYDMHYKSGLLADLDEARAGDISRTGTKSVIEEMALARLDGLFPGKAGQFPMCGNNIPFDRGFLKVDMPKLEGWFHYRNLDVSTIKNACRLLNPGIYAQLPEKNKGHRALDDIYESIAEYQFYVDNFLWASSE